MKKRGKVLRDTSAGPGLMMIESKQYPFTLEGMWVSEHAPRINMAVEVEFDQAGSIIDISPLPESQVAREQAELALAAAKAKGSALASNLVGRFGLNTLAGLGALVIGWFFLNTVSIQTGPFGASSISFWKVLSLLNSPTGVMAVLGGGDTSTGIYGLLAVAALLAPLAPYFWQDRRAYLGGVIPLVFMLFVSFMVYHGISSGINAANGAAAAFGGADMEKMMADVRNSMVHEAMRAVSMGAGAYLALAASLYFAAKGTMKYFASGTV